MEVRNLSMFENLLQKVMELNEMPGVDVYLCVNGETQVMALSVMQNKTLVYQNRFFFSRLDNKVKEVTEHLEKNAGGSRMWKEYYTDGVTKRTDSLYICSCSCGKCYWSCTYQKQCSECGRDLISCEPASKKRTAK
ncbi:MAG: hypothetical protein ACLTJ5_05015 [Clostridium sp.]